MNDIAKIWINSPLLNKKEKNEIIQLKDEEIDTYFTNSNQTFGTAGVRGIMGMGTQKMNRFTYANLTQAYCQYLVNTYGTDSQIVIGYDNRQNSKKFAKLCASIASSFKIKALLFKRLTPTPIVSYAIRQLKAVGGIIITASHNPKEYNGFKVYHNDGGQILNDVVVEISKYLKQAQDVLNITHLPNKQYINFINKNITSKYLIDIRNVFVDKNIISENKPFSVVFTGHHGTASKLLPKFLRGLNFQIVPVKKQCFYNDSFKNSPAPNPETEKSFEMGIEVAEKINSKIIIGVDPDADRMAVMIKHNNQ
jgi:phosphomannomutase